MSLIHYIILIVLLVSSLGLYYVYIFNILQHHKTRIEIAENKIDDSLRSKYDIICDINIEVKKVIKNKDYLFEFISLKNKRLTNYETDRKLIEAVNLINELISDYSEINNKVVQKKLSEIKKIDEELTASKNFYNKYTSSLNILIRKFPTNIISKIHKFRIKPFFDNKNMQDKVLDDFKL